ncbi:MAG: hypothetical protein ACR2PR_12985 [Pseudohongiellaceae bacterium]
MIIPEALIAFQKRAWKIFRLHSRAVGILTLLLVLPASQTIASQHHHEGELTHFVDCVICVKQSHESDFLPVDVNTPQSPIKFSGLVANLAPTIPFLVTPSPNNRSPPLV